jgi:hypothetical protein
MLKVVPTGERQSELEKVRLQIKEQLNGLKVGSTAAKTSRRLLEAIENVNKDPGNHECKRIANRVVRHRLASLKRLAKDYESEQRRDLKIIIFFGQSNGLDPELRNDACALLQLWGGEEPVAEVCRVFPGMRKLFDQ